MKIVKIADVAKEEVKMDGALKAFKQLPIGSADDSPNFSFRVFTLEPGGYTPKHVHPYEHVNYVISGEGTLFSEKAGEQPISKGDFALVQPNEKHQYKNVSENEPFVMICAVLKDFE